MSPPILKRFVGKSIAEWAGENRERIAAALAMNKAPPLRVRATIWSIACLQCQGAAGAHVHPAKLERDKTKCVGGRGRLKGSGSAGDADGTQCECEEHTPHRLLFTS
eukprot:25408_4